MIYGQPKEGVTTETAPKAWTDFKKALKNVNLEMMGPWGPFGVPEGMAYMLKGKNADFEKYPIEKSRTVSLYTMPWAE